MQIKYEKIFFISFLEVVILTLFLQQKLISQNLIVGVTTIVLGFILLYFIIMRIPDESWNNNKKGLQPKIFIGVSALVYGFASIGLYQLLILILSI